jgi:transaldolase
MKIFLDSADIDEIRELSKTNFIDGVTTNPSLIAKSGRNILEVIEEICSIISGPVSAEVTATDYETMMLEANRFIKLAKNVSIKVPLTRDGLQTCRTLSEKGVSVNVTLCFSPSQAILAAKAGASFISPFVGRLDDIGQNGLDLIYDIVEIYNNYDFKTEVLVASVRGVHHIVESAKIGANIVTIPAKTFKEMYNHPLTDKGLASFLSDWKKTGQSIL